MKTKIAIVLAIVIALSAFSIPIGDADNISDEGTIVELNGQTTLKESYDCNKLIIHENYSIKTESGAYSAINLKENGVIAIIDGTTETDYSITGNLTIEFYNGFSVKTIDDETRNVDGKINLIQTLSEAGSNTELSFDFKDGSVSEKKISDDNYKFSIKNVDTLEFKYSNPCLLLVLPIITYDCNLEFEMTCDLNTMFSRLVDAYNKWHSDDAMAFAKSIDALFESFKTIDLTGTSSDRESDVKIKLDISFEHSDHLINIKMINPDTLETYGYATFNYKDSNLTSFFEQRLDSADILFYLLKCFEDIHAVIDNQALNFDELSLGIFNGVLDYDRASNKLHFDAEEIIVNGQIDIELLDASLHLAPELTLYSFKYAGELRDIDTKTPEGSSTAEIMKRFSLHFKTATGSIYSIEDDAMGKLTIGEYDIDFKLSFKDLGVSYEMIHGDDYYDRFIYDFKTINRISEGTGIYNNYNINVYEELPFGITGNSKISLSEWGRVQVEKEIFNALFDDEPEYSFLDVIQLDYLNVNRLVAINDEGKVTSDVTVMKMTHTSEHDYYAFWFEGSSFLSPLGMNLLDATAGTSLIIDNRDRENANVVIDGEANLSGLSLILELIDKKVGSITLTEGSRVSFNDEEFISTTNVKQNDGSEIYAIQFDYIPALMGYNIETFDFIADYCGEKYPVHIKFSGSLLSTYISSIEVESEKDFVTVIDGNIAYAYLEDLTTMSVEGKTYKAPAGALLELVLDKKSSVGYTFDHWKLADGTTVVFVPEQKSSSPVDILPATESCSFTITYDANGGKGTFTTEPILYGSSAEITSGSSFSLTGWKFLNWNTRADGNGISYSPGDKAGMISNVNGSNITLYAQWGAQTYKIVDPAEKETRPMYLQLGQSYGVYLADQMDSEGYFFAGWFIDSERVYSSTIVKSTGNVTSKWVAKENTLKVVLNQGDYYFVTLTKGMTYAKALVNPVNPTRYEFKGWFFYDTGRAVDMTAVAESGTVYASWTPKEIKVLIDETKHIYHYDEVLILPDAPESMSDFDCWLLESNGVSAYLQPGDNFLVRNEIVVTAVPLKTKDVKVEPQFDGKKIESSSNVVVTVDGEVLAYPWTATLAYGAHDAVVEYTDSTGSMHRMQKALIVDKNTDKEVFNFISDKRMKAYVVNEVNEAYIMSNGGLGALVGSSSGMDATVLLRASIPDDRLIDTLVTAAGKNFTILEEFDLTITKIMSKDGAIKELTRVDEVGNSIEIVVKLSPGIISKYAEHGFDLEDLIIYRTHACNDGKVATEKIPCKSEGSGGEYFSIIDGSSILLHVSKFSAYGIAIPNNLLIKAVDTEGGKITVDRETASAGDIVSVTAKASDGYKFAGWKTSEGVSIVDGKFAMPNGNVTISAVWEKTQNGNIALIATIVIALLVVIVVAIAIYLKKKSAA